MPSLTEKIGQPEKRDVGPGVAGGLFSGIYPWVPCQALVCLPLEISRDKRDFSADAQR